MRTLIPILLLSLTACDGQPSTPDEAFAPPTTNAATLPAGMSKYVYLAADGGPHMLLPTGLPRVDYRSACAATTTAQMAVMPFGAASAMILADPPMTAWGMSPDGYVDVYYLKSWVNVNLDALITKATTALPTASLADSGSVLRLPQPDAFLLFAGDTPTSTAYGVHRVTIAAGNYKILTGTFAAQGESVTVYRLVPVGTK